MNERKYPIYMTSFEIGLLLHDLWLSRNSALRGIFQQLVDHFEGMKRAAGVQVSIWRFENAEQTIEREPYPWEVDSHCLDPPADLETEYRKQLEGLLERLYTLITKMSKDLPMSALPTMYQTLVDGMSRMPEFTAIYKDPNFIDSMETFVQDVVTTANVKEVEIPNVESGHQDEEYFYTGKCPLCNKRKNNISAATGCCWECDNP